ncbi:MAG: hypothetical protein L6V93_22515 [Clostridiales bacterium]|nr:MAG: hypothetical protein L6V93_22515 [Clostridiales bacterium]
MIEHIGAEFETGGFEIKKRRTDENEEKYFADLIKKEQKKLDLVKKAYENEIDTLEEYKQNKARILKKRLRALKIKLDGAEKNAVTKHGKTRIKKVRKFNCRDVR